jgi:hypothetical protein
MVVGSAAVVMVTAGAVYSEEKHEHALEMADGDGFRLAMQARDVLGAARLAAAPSSTARFRNEKMMRV